MRLAGVLALALVGGFIGWLVAASAAPSNTELRKAATELVPNRAWLTEVDLVDRPASFSHAPWDVGGSRYAQAVLNPPVKIDEEAFQEAVARRAAPTAWSRTGTRNGGPVYRRAKLEATIELTAFEPGVGLEASIRIRPRSLSPALAVAAGGTCGLLAGAVLARLLGRRRRVGADAA